MSRYSFPNLDKKEIIKSLAELGAPKLSVENLTTPTADVLGPVYEYLVTLIDHATSREELMQPAFGALHLLGDYPELYTDAVGILKSFRRLRNFMSVAGADDFSMFDISRPDSLRTIRFLSAAINFCIFSNQKIAFLSQLEEAARQELWKADELREELSKIQSEVAAIEEERLAEQPQVQALELETKELGHHILALNKQQSGLQSDIMNLKQESNNRADKLSNLDFVIMQKQQEGAQLRAQIVENPQELQRTLEDKNLVLREEEALYKNAFDNSRKWKAKLEVLAKAEKKLLKNKRMLQSLEEQINARKTADKDMKERKARLKAIEKEQWAAEAKMVELKLEEQRLQEQFEKIDQQKNAKYDEVSKEQETLRSRNAQRVAEHGARQQALAEIKNQIEVSQRRCQELLAGKEEKVAKIQSAKAELMKKAIEYNQLILSRTGLENTDLNPMRDALKLC